MWKYELETVTLSCLVTRNALPRYYKFPFRSDGFLYFFRKFIGFSSGRNSIEFSLLEDSF